MPTLNRKRPGGTGRRAAALSYARRRRWLLIRRSLMAAMAVILVVGGAVAWRFGEARHWPDRIMGQALAATGAAGLRVAHLRVSGRRQVGRAALERAVGAALGDPILAVDLKAARARIEELPWVRRSVVRRLYPDTLSVRLIERRPFALWQYQGRFALIDRDGTVITRDGLAAHAQLPLVVGRDAPRHAAPLMALLADRPELRDRLRAAVRVGGRRWRLRFDNGVSVELPERGAADAWHRLAALERDRRLLESDIIAVDLRQPDRLVLRLTPAAAKRLKSSASNT